ncbi:DUF3010 family protein [Vibrio crassostreae]|uniref:DUF3010 family protein n=1 Tax=Vibrio crassostreae TaxID=246167 RepID=UPI001B3055B5|nr:DUF3010 family protein [Vibrio crassostreae]
MKVCGVEIKGDDAIVCLVEKDEDGIELIAEKKGKVSVGGSKDSLSMRQFQDDFLSLMTKWDVKNVIIKERMTKGKFAGGAMSFKIESAIQLIRELEVTTVTSNELKKYEKGKFLPIEFENTGLKAYQQQAYTSANFLLFA